MSLDVSGSDSSHAARAVKVSKTASNNSRRVRRSNPASGRNRGSPDNRGSSTANPASSNRDNKVRGNPACRPGRASRQAYPDKLDRRPLHQCRVDRPARRP